MDCVFCAIISGDIETKLVYEDNQVVVFNDLYPKAPVHQLIVPRVHIPSVADLDPNDIDLPGHMIQIARQMAVKANIDQSGYRLIFNCRHDGGQEIDHLHLHLLGGRPLNF